jgi:predicted Zn-dependent protease
VNKPYRTAILIGTILSLCLLVMLAFPDSITASTQINNSTYAGAGLQRQLQADTQDQVKTGTDANVQESQHNHPPNADAGNNKIVRESENVELDGGGSSDRDGDKLTYSWGLVSPKNLKVKLDNANSADANFIAPTLDGATSKKNLVFKLTVSDGNFKATDIVRISVTPLDTGSKDNNDNNKIRTMTVIDTGEQPSKNQFFASDVCGAGTYAYSYLVSGVKWRTFPVTFAIDATNSHIDINAAKTAVRKAFAAIDALNQPAGIFFQETSNYAAAKIKFTWKYIDGPYNKLGYTTFSYRTDTKALISATVTLDSGDKYFISPTERCGGSGSLFDIQNIATHEIGHAINLGHVSDKLQSMYPSSLAGETLKRTLGNGDIRGISNLY